mgnify:CR=1 FL=1
MSSPTTQKVRKAIQKTLETVFCRVRLSTTQTDLTNNTWTKVLLNVVDYDQGKNFDVTTNNRFTVPVTGLYHIIASIEFTGVIATKRYKTGIYKNGASIREVTKHSSVADNITVDCSDYFYLQANDYIELYGYAEAGVSTVDILSGSKATILAIYLVTKEGIRQ